LDELRKMENLATNTHQFFRATDESWYMDRLTGEILGSSTKKIVHPGLVHVGSCHLSPLVNNPNRVIQRCVNKQYQIQVSYLCWVFWLLEGMSIPVWNISYI
jgi:hypothetical protein